MFDSRSGHRSWRGHDRLIDVLAEACESDEIDVVDALARLPRRLTDQLKPARGTPVRACCVRISLCMARGLPAWFDAREYLRLNPDLQEAGFTPRRAIAHFASRGHRERRDYSTIAASGPSNGYGSCALVVAVDREDARDAIECASLLVSEGSFSMVVCLVRATPAREVERAGGRITVTRHFGSPIVASAYAKGLNPRVVLLFGRELYEWVACPDYAYKCVSRYPRVEDTAAGAEQRELCVLSYLYRGDSDAEAPYFRSLISALRIARGGGVRFVLALALFDENHDGSLSFRKLSDRETVFGFDGDPETRARSFARSFRADDVLYVPNKGLDYGPFFAAIRLYMTSAVRSVTKIHAKANLQWREGLLKACYMSPRPGEVIVAGRWWSAATRDDKNASNVKSLARLLGLREDADNYSFPAGSILTMPSFILERVVDSFASVYTNLTGRGRVDPSWLGAMRDEDYYARESARLASCPYNAPVSHDCLEILERSGAKNYIDLLDAGARGIPDCMIEHAWERILGLLILADSCHVTLA
jgi:hypothetical protein